MVLDTIKHSNIKYLAFQSEGNAAQFIIPFAKKVCLLYAGTNITYVTLMASILFISVINKY